LRIIVATARSWTSAQRHFSAFGLRAGVGAFRRFTILGAMLVAAGCVQAPPAIPAGQPAPFYGATVAPPYYGAASAPLPLPGPASDANTPPALPANVSPAPAPAVTPPVAAVAPAAPAQAAPIPATAAAPQAGGLMLSPISVVAPVTANVILVAGVYDAARQLVPFERVDWTLTPGSAGQITGLGEAPRGLTQNLFSEPPRGIDANHAIGETFGSNIVLTRGTPSPTDNITVLRGQTWLSVGSPVEGTGYVTALAPTAANPNARQQTAVIHWVDARWTAPPAASVAAGARHTLTTTVLRQSTNAPIAGWRVRYEMAGGTAAGFAPDGSRSIEVATDAQGRANAELFQQQSAGGVSSVSVQLNRPAAAGVEALTIGSTKTAITWTGAPATSPAAGPTLGAAAVDMRLTGPAQATVGGEVHFDLEITNRGAVATGGLVVVDRFDDGLIHAAAVSPIQRELDPLAPGETRKIGITFKVAKPGRLCQNVELTGAGGLRQTTGACVQADAPAASTPPGPAAPGSSGKPALTLKVSGPASAKVGQNVEFVIEVRNTGSATIPTVRVSDTYDTQTLRPVATDDGYTRVGAQFVWTLQNLTPGKVEYRRLRCVCLDAANRACDQATVTDGGDLTLHDEACVQILPGEAPGVGANPGGNLKVQISARTNPLKAGSDSSYQVTITNAGQNSERKVALAVTVPDLEQLVEGQNQNPAKAAIDGQTIRFDPIAELKPGETLTFDVGVHASRAGDATTRADVTSQALVTPTTAETPIHVFADQ
jgi:uncharacterized repeat protein (TIGR01451 family)